MTCIRLFVCVRPWLLTVCLLSICQVTRGGFERSCSRDRRHFIPRGICGANLSFLLSTVCSMYNKRGSVDPIPSLASSESRSVMHDYNSHYQYKRASRNRPAIPADVKRAHDSNIFLSRPEALSMLKRDMSIRGTITCECCIHRCSFPELTQYCSVPNTNFIRKRPGIQWGKRSSAQYASKSDATQEDRDLLLKGKIGQSLLQKSPVYWQDMADGNTGDIIEYDDSVEHVQDWNESPKRALPYTV